MSKKVFSKIFVLLLVVGLLFAVAPTGQAQAQTPTTLNVADWSEIAPVGLTGRPSVLFDGTTYHMWYGLDLTGGATELYYTTSTTPGSFLAGTKVTFDTAPLEQSSVTVIKEGDTFNMIAYGADAQEFALYTSSNGLAWTKGATIFDAAGMTDLGKIDAPFVFNDGGVYKLYFQLKNAAGDRYYIYLATSATVGGTYTNPSLVLSPSATLTDWDGKFVMHPTVVKDGGTYYMWYSAHNSVGAQRIGLATSLDGINWTKSPANPVIGSVGEPSVIKVGDTWHMYYLGTGSAVQYISATGPFEFQTIQAAINAVEAETVTEPTTYVINVAAGEYVENLVINKITDTKSYEILGAEGTTLKGTININSDSHYYDSTLLIKGIEFVDNTPTVGNAVIKFGNDSATRYASNVTIEDCTFTGTDQLDWGIEPSSGSGVMNILIKDCDLIDMHSLAQISSGGITIEGCTFTNSARGINLNASSGILIKDTFMNDPVEKYAVRVGQSSGTPTDQTMTIIGSTLLSSGSSENLADPETVLVLRGDAPKNIVITDSTISNTAGDCDITLSSVGADPTLYTLTFTNVDWGTDGMKLCGLEGATIINNTVHNLTQDTWHSTIQGAIDAVTAVDGDVIEVGPGTYAETVVINKPNLTLQSSGTAEETIVLAPTGVGISVLKELGTVTVDGFTVEGWTTAGISQSWTQRAGTTFIVKNNIVNGTGDEVHGNCIQVTGDDSLIEGNVVDGAYYTGTGEYGASGILVYLANNAIVRNNVVTNADIGIAVAGGGAYGQSSMTGALVIDNEVSLSEIGIGVSFDANNTTIEDNFVHDNELGLLEEYNWGYGPTGTVALHNQLVDNIEQALTESYDETTPIPSGHIFMAEANWWGSIAGPGETEINEYVDYTPWCADAACTALLPAELGMDPAANTDPICNIGTETIIAVKVGPVAELSGYTVKVNFDPTKVEVLDVYNGDVLTGDGLEFKDLGNSSGQLTLDWAKTGTVGEGNLVTDPDGGNLAYIKVKHLTVGEVVFTLDAGTELTGTFDQILYPYTVTQETSTLTICGLVAENFNWTSGDTGGWGWLSGISAGFRLEEATFAGATSLVVELRAADETVLQRDTAVLDKFADLTQITAPFDIYGNFNYTSDGYWDNERFGDYGTTTQPACAVATATLANGQVVTAENCNLTGEESTIELSLVAEDFTYMDFSNVLGVTAGFHPVNFSMDQATSLKVELFTGTSGAYTLLQTNTSPHPADHGTAALQAFSGPFDIFGSFDYTTDLSPYGTPYWNNVRAAEYGQTAIPTRVLATVVMPGGLKVTAENLLLDGDRTTILPEIKGTVKMQGRLTEFAGVPVTLTAGTVVYNTTSSDLSSLNYIFDAIEGYEYTFTTKQPRYLNVTVDLEKTLLADKTKTLTELRLRAGNAYWSDDVVNNLDLGVVGNGYTEGYHEWNDADVNFDENVNIQDLALVAGNYLLDSAAAYADWQP